MTAAPKVTIIVPVYNVEQYLEECIESIKTQTLSNWEAILVNDGSTDQSGSICDRYAALDARIKVIHKPNGGQSSARNIAVQQSQGQYITFLDSDDVYDNPLLLEQLTAQMDTDPGLDFVEFGSTQFTETGLKSPLNVFKENSILTDKADIYLAMNSRRMLTIACDKLFRSQVVKSVPPFPHGVYFEDERWLMGVLPKVNKVAFSTVSGYSYRIRTGSITHPSGGFNARLTHDLFLKDLHGMQYAIQNKTPIQVYLNYSECALREYKNYHILATDNKLQPYEQQLSQTLPSLRFLAQNRSQLSSKSLIQLSSAKIFGPAFLRLLVRMALRLRNSN